jgi:hypothetical protein
MKNDKRDKLIQLGTEALADALLKLAERNDQADDMIERMTAMPAELVKQIKSKLTGLKRRRSFVDWRGAQRFTNELEGLLDDVKAAVEDAKVGVELTASFFRADRSIFERCDDSSGFIGGIFRFKAMDIFVEYARCYEDKDRLVDLVIDMMGDDGYCVRECLVDAAAQYLPETNMRRMINRFQTLANKEEGKHEKRHWLGQIESLARQLGDAPLFEKTRIESWGEPGEAACLDIASVYLESGDARKALSWVNRIPERLEFKEYDRRKLLTEIYRQAGDTEKLTGILWEIFRASRSRDNLETLLEVVGKDRADEIMEREVRLIMGQTEYCSNDVSFLVEMERFDEAEACVLNHPEQLNGDFYSTLLPIAKAMEQHERCLGATVIYRSLLDSIMDRVISKYYSHGVRYLKKLEGLAVFIDDWRGHTEHESYMEAFRKKHSRKYSFWAKYGE